MLVEYLTIDKEAAAIIIAKKSKFIAALAPICTVEQGEEFIASIRREHYSASHNVPAYIVGLTGDVQKCSDDGEPSGTAGLPILDLLKGHGLVNVVVVVTRYFGGTLLGRGGLIRAYGKAAQAGLNAAGIVRMIPRSTVEVTVDYALSGKVQNYLIQSGAQIGEISYLAAVTFPIQLDPAKVQQMYQELQDITAAAFQWTVTGEVYQRRKLE